MRKFFEDLEKQNYNINAEVFYFNYDLNRHTWRYIVNKQIVQTYERLLYERRLHEIEARRKKLENEIKKLDLGINQVKVEKRELQEGPYRRGGPRGNLGKRSH